MEIKYDINRPWLTLDKWQKDYINTDPDEDCFLLCGRQSGKTTAMSIKAVELCLKHFKKGFFVLISSITEKQGYLMLARAQAYAEELYPGQIKRGKDKPTKHILQFKNGTGILCYAAGDAGVGLRGFTIKKHMVDEGSRMSEEFFISTGPMMSVTEGSEDIASTPHGKHWPDGTPKYFYKCSLDDDYKKFYVSAEDCPRHSKEFLAKQKKKLPKLAYAQEYLAIFTDKLKRIYSDELIKELCILKRVEQINLQDKHYLGVDVAGFGKDDCAYEGFEKLEDRKIEQRENIIEKRNYTTDTTKKILSLNNSYNYRSIGVDDGGPGFGVFSELMDNPKTKKKTVALNNASRIIDSDGKRSKRLLKEDMHMNLLSLMENHKILFLDDDEVKDSLASIQSEDGKIFGFDAHVAEGIVRGVWEATKDKSLKPFIRSF